MTDFAENLPYWNTSKQSPDRWIARARTEIERAGGEVLAEGFGSQGDDAAYMIRFLLDGEKYRVVWPCVESKFETPSKNFEGSARRQAATMLYHDVKAACVKARVLGARVAFFAHLELKDGTIASECIGGPAQLPKMLGPAR